MDECKPLHAGLLPKYRLLVEKLAGKGQGLTLVHCSAQPEPFVIQNTP